VWTYPATPQHARLIRSSIPRLEVSERFTALIGQKAEAAQSAASLAPAPRPEPALELPSGLKTKPWRHQIEAFQFAMERLLRGGGAALLALEMGVGKTLVALMVLAAMAARRVLICCPLRVVPVWQQQIERHLDLPLIVVSLDDSVSSVSNKKKLAEEKLRLAEATGRPLAVIINYDSVWRAPFAEWAEQQQWDLVIADESHRLKAPGGKASLAFKRLRSRARARLALTGTPLPHSPLDAYAQFRFLDSSIFGPSFAAFRQKYAVMGGFQKKQVTGFQHLDELEALMKTITFRVSKDVLDLPPETHVTYECELSPEALRVYRDLEEDFVAEVRDGRVTAANAMVKLLRLQQVAGGSVKTDDGLSHRVDSAKQNLLADTLEDIGAGEPVVVFCRFHADLDAVHEAAKTAGFESLELSGRRDELKRWQDGEAQVLAVQISAGGVGVDLTRARYSIYYSLSFSLGEYDQALSRVHRPGQTRPVEHIHLVARNTVDRKIMRALEARAEVVEAILAEIKA
jgi:SNF2 family DNA or RNA helicase